MVMDQSPRSFISIFGILSLLLIVVTFYYLFFLRFFSFSSSSSFFLSFAFNFGVIFIVLLMLLLFQFDVVSVLLQSAFHSLVCFHCHFPLFFWCLSLFLVNYWLLLFCWSRAKWEGKKKIENVGGKRGRKRSILLDR